MGIEIGSINIDEIVTLILKVIGLIWPEQIDKIQKEFNENKEQYEKDRKEALVAILSGNSSKLTELVNKWLQKT